MSLPAFDIFSATEAIFKHFQRAGKGGMVRLAVYKSSAWNGYRIDMLLNRYGIRAYGRRLQDDRRSFLVHRTQARWTEYILCRAGAPLASEPLDQRNIDLAAQHQASGALAPPPWKERGLAASTPLEYIRDFIALFAGKESK